MNAVNVDTARASCKTAVPGQFDVDVTPIRNSANDAPRTSAFEDVKSVIDDRIGISAVGRICVPLRCRGGSAAVSGHGDSGDIAVEFGQREARGNSRTRLAALSNFAADFPHPAGAAAAISSAQSPLLEDPSSLKLHPARSSIQLEAPS
ncbi:unnamed protein product [Lampetra planeri]